MDLVGLDFETYSPANLPKVGLKNYVMDPEFRVLLAAVSRVSDDPAYSAETMVIDFTDPEDTDPVVSLATFLEDKYIVAHNAMFEWACLMRLGISVPFTKFIDSAMISRVAGVGSSLEAAAPQALEVDKLPSGKEGIQLFSIPGTYQMEKGDDAFDPQVIEDHPQQWSQFKEYCAMDAALSLTLATQLVAMIHDSEPVYNAITMRMNSIGWTVDMDLVRAMNDQFLANVDEEVEKFRQQCDAPDLNLNSHKQLVEWCKARGVNAKSFDELAVEKTISRITARLEKIGDDDPKAQGYREVLLLLHTKQAMGGSSLKKLQTIMDTAYTHDDGTTTLYDSYLHAGASTTLRTTGRGVQMQNLRRLNGKPDDVTEVLAGKRWSNDRLSHNLRQVFTASQPDGFLIVGDYSAVESRGLAWLAGEEWKLDAYRQGKDVYKEQAAQFQGKEVSEVTPDDRQFGKLGELSCGYMAGANAVQSFSEKIGMHISHGEAAKLVSDFRTTNVKTVQFWVALQSALEEALDLGLSQVAIPQGTIEMHVADCIPSLKNQEERSDLKTLLIKVSIPTKDDPFTFTRIFHGVHRNGRDIQYWKPSARKTGDLWVPDTMDPKTKERRRFTLYGGKLAGVLTQSLCREIFMNGMTDFSLWASHTENVDLIGQFHDEMVVDWVPEIKATDPDLGITIGTLEKVMSKTTLPSFPLACDVKFAYRYIK
jgi:DNA polymerase